MKTCLVVDDSSVIRKVARRILEGLDFQIVEAEDGQEALEVCKRAMPEAVLLDWNMPVMDGYEFLGNLRRMPGGDAPKVVFCTTENDVAHIARALHAGANEYIMKPFDKDIVTVVNMRARLGLPNNDDGKPPMAVGVDLRGESYGLLIDQIGEVLKLRDDGREENPVNLDPRMAKLAGGVHRLDGQLMVVLDVDRVLEIVPDLMAA